MRKYFVVIWRRNIFILERWWLEIVYFINLSKYVGMCIFCKYVSFYAVDIFLIKQIYRSSFGSTDFPWLRKTSWVFQLISDHEP